jgi:gamma-glutamyltranspeptidase/glutathione hydrolase
MANSLPSLCRAAVMTSTLLSCHAFAQATPPLSPCTLDSRVPACDAVRGDRADGWRAQSRAEVMAPHAMVAASQPLAAQAGLQIMRGGGNAHRCSGRRRSGTQSG